MKKTILTLLIALLSLTSFAQQEIEISELPEKLFGQFSGPDKNWSFDFMPDFFNYPGIPRSTISSAFIADSIYHLRLKPINPNKKKEAQTVRIQIVDNFTLHIYDKENNDSYKKFVRVPISELQYPDISDIVNLVKGKWYLTNGTNKEFIEFKQDHLVVEDENWHYKQYMIYRNQTHQLDISGPKNGGFIHFNKKGDQYLTIRFTGKGIKYLKRSPNLPDKKGTDWANLPFDIEGEWFSCQNPSNFYLKPYKITYNGIKSNITEIKAVEETIQILFRSNKKNISLSISKIDDKHLSVSLNNQNTGYFTSESKGGFGIDSKNLFINDWYDLKSNNKEISISETKITGKNINSPYDRLVFDGINYKYLYKNNVVALVKKYSDGNISFNLPKQKKPQYLKDDTLKPNYLVRDNVPNNLLKNWLHPTTGEWLIGLSTNKVIYKSSVWNYGDIIDYNDGNYMIHLSKIDTVCYTDKSGAKLCKLVERFDSIQVKKTKKNTSFTFDKHHQIALVSEFKDVDYRPNELLPASKPGYAILRFQYFGNPNDVKDKMIEVYTNNFYFLDQLKRTTAFNDKGYAQVKIPMAWAQPVYVSTFTYGRIFLSPGDTLFAGVESLKGKRFENLIWMGASPQLNHDLTQYDIVHWGMGKYSDQNRENYKLKPNEYTQSRIKITHLMREQDKEYQSKNNTCEAFQELLTNSHQISEWEDRLRYQMYYRRYHRNAEDIPDSYFSFLNDIDYLNKKYRYSEDLNGLLRSVYYYADRKSMGGTIRITHQDIVAYTLENDTTLTIEQRDSLKKKLIHLNKELNGKKIDDIRAELEKLHKIEIDKKLKELSTDGKKKKWLSQQELISIFEKNQTLYSNDDFQVISDWMLNPPPLSKNITDRFNSNAKKIFAQKRQKSNKNMVQFYPGNESSKEFFIKSGILKQFVDELENFNHEQIEKKYEKVKALEIDPVILKQAEEIYQSTIALINQPMPGDINLASVKPGSAEEFMAKLAQKHSGKVCYIDVWAPWCSPCRGELQKAPALKKKFEDKNVAFVYVCGSGDKAAWENCIKKYKVKGDHYFIPESTYKQLRNKYLIKGIPHFMIMDKKGVVVENSTSRPSNLQTTSDKLNLYLNQN